MIQNPIKRETRLPSVTGGGQVTQLILKNSSTIISVRHSDPITLRVLIMRYQSVSLSANADTCPP